jgi:hypothetical protein
MHGLTETDYREFIDAEGQREREEIASERYDRAACASDSQQINRINSLVLIHGWGADRIASVMGLPKSTVEAVIRGRKAGA